MNQVLKERKNAIFSKKETKKGSGILKKKMEKNQ